MNRHTFKDVANSKRDSLAHDAHFDEDDDDDAPVRRARGNEDGEEELENSDKFNDAGEVLEAFNLK